MTIPEPTAETLATDLQALYAHVYNGVQLSQMGVRKLISRCYYAERERDELRARVAELEGIVGAAEKMYEAADCYCENWEPDCDLGTALAVAMENYMISTATKGVAGENMP